MAIMRVARSVRAEVRVRGPSFDSAPNSSDLSYPASLQRFPPPCCLGRRPAASLRWPRTFRSLCKCKACACWRCSQRTEFDRLCPCPCPDRGGSSPAFFVHRGRSIPSCCIQVMRYLIVSASVTNDDVCPGQMQLFGRKPPPTPAGQEGGLPPRPGATVITWMPSGPELWQAWPAPR